MTDLASMTNEVSEQQLALYRYWLTINFIVTAILTPIVLCAILRKTPTEVRFQKALFFMTTMCSFVMNLLLVCQTLTPQTLIQYLHQPVYYGRYYGGYSNGLLESMPYVMPVGNGLVGSVLLLFCISFSIGFSYQSYKINAVVSAKRISTRFFMLMEYGNNGFWFFAVLTVIVIVYCIATLLHLHSETIDPKSHPDLLEFQVKHPSASFIDLPASALGKILLACYLSTGVIAFLHALKCNYQILHAIHKTKNLVSAKTFRMQWTFYRHYAAEAVISVFGMHLPVVFIALRFLDVVQSQLFIIVAYEVFSIHSNLMMLCSVICVAPYRRWVLHMVGVGSADSSRNEVTSKQQSNLNEMERRAGSTNSTARIKSSSSHTRSVNMVLPKVTR